MFLVESAEKPDRPFRTGNPETTARRIWVRVTPGIGSVFLIHPTGQKRQEKKCFFLNGVVTRSFATPLSANMMPSFRESSRGHQKFQYPPKT